jgi:hypothetical protein
MGEYRRPQKSNTIRVFYMSKKRLVTTSLFFFQKKEKVTSERVLFHMYLHSKIRDKKK